MLGGAFRSDVEAYGFIFQSNNFVSPGRPIRRKRSRSTKGNNPKVGTAPQPTPRKDPPLHIKRSGIAYVNENPVPGGIVAYRPSD